MKTAGCAIETDAKQDWLHEGDFDAAIKKALENIEKEMKHYNNMPIKTSSEPSKNHATDSLKYLKEQHELSKR